MPTPMIPEQYQLSDDYLRFEQETLDFHLSVSHVRYMRWYDIVPQIDPSAHYQVTSFTTLQDVRLGADLLTETFEWVTKRSCSYINHLIPVPADHQIPWQDQWGNSDLNLEHDPWDLTFYPVLEPTAIAHVHRHVTAAAIDQVSRRIIDQALINQQPIGPDAHQEAVRTIAGAFTARYHQRITDGHVIAYQAAHQFATAVSRIAHSLALLKTHGIDLEQHPEYHTMQVFYDREIPPPTHLQMAEIIIADTAPDQGPTSSA